VTKNDYFFKFSLLDGFYSKVKPTVCVKCNYTAFIGLDLSILEEGERN
jgi:hypothetical protein